MQQSIFHSSRSSRLIKAALILALVPGLSGCTDEEIGTAIGVIAIGAGAAIVIANGGGQPADRGPHGHDRGDHGDRGGHGPGFGGPGMGGPGMGGPGFGGPGRPGGPRMSLDLTELQTDAAVSGKRSVESVQSIRISDFAKTFSLSQESSRKFLVAMDQASQGNSAALRALGLSQEDLQRMKSYELPADESLRNVARSLRADFQSTKDMVDALMQKAIEQRVALERSKNPYLDRN